MIKVLGTLHRRHLLQGTFRVIKKKEKLCGREGDMTMGRSRRRIKLEHVLKKTRVAFKRRG